MIDNCSECSLIPMRMSFTSYGRIADIYSDNQIQKLKGFVLVERIKGLALIVINKWEISNLLNHNRKDFMWENLSFWLSWTLFRFHVNDRLILLFNGRRWISSDKWTRTFFSWLFFDLTSLPFNFPSSSY